MYVTVPHTIIAVCVTRVRPFPENVSAFSVSRTNLIYVVGASATVFAGWVFVCTQRSVPLDALADASVVKSSAFVVVLGMVVRAVVVVVVVVHA